VSTLWSDHIAGLVPYVPGEQARIPNLLKLNTNENPYGPSPRAIEAMRAALTDDLRLYPDYQALALRSTIADRFGLAPDQVFLGNGSDEILAHVFNALFLRGGRPLWLPDVTYSFYRTYCRLYDVPHRLLPLDEDFALRVADYTGPAAPEPAGIIFANPNAPTGRTLTLDEIEAIARARPDSAVVVDEAYVDFGGESAITLVAKYPNLLVCQTLSKARSLAGLRVGFAVGSAELIEALNRVKNSFNSYPLDRLALAGARAAFEDDDWFRATCEGVIGEREWVASRLEALGFEVLPSKANFVFARHPGHKGEVLANGLREQGVIVRHFNKPRISDFLRITTGTADQNKRLIECLEALV
jgi:histidinol-phosphate aminotransferase